MLGPRDRENPMRETTAYRAISISSHMVGIPGHCEKECDFKIRNDEIQHWDPTGGHGTPRRDPFFWLHTSTHTLPTSPGPLQSKLCLVKNQDEIAKAGARSDQERPKRATRVFRSAKECPRAPQERPKSAPRAPQERP